MTHRGNVDKTTGHIWDEDLRELNNPLPRWWLFLFIFTLVFAVGYLALYPGLGDDKGTLNWSSKGPALRPRSPRPRSRKRRSTLPSVPLRSKTWHVIPRLWPLVSALFLNNCAACHGSDAKGSEGFPNLTDNDWLHGGSPEKISETLHGGRRGMMPPMAAAVGGPEEVRQVANYVLSLSGSGHNSILAELGKDKFKAACAACHGADGKGMQAAGRAQPDRQDLAARLGRRGDHSHDQQRQDQRHAGPGWSSVRRPDQGVDRLRLGSVASDADS